MRWWTLVKDTTTKWWNDNALRLAASLSFYTVFALSPLLIIVIAVAGFVFGQEQVQREIIAQISELVGESSAEQVSSMLKSARPSGGLRATLFSLVTLLVFATGVFVEMQDGLNTMWKCPPQDNQTVWRLLKERFLSFLLILVIGFLMLVSLVFDTVLGVVGRYLTDLLPAPETILHLLNFGFALAALFVLFAMIYRLFPRANIAWRDVWTGAAVTAVLFLIGKLLIGMYLGKAGVASAYGAASSFMVILLWVYYSSLIFYFGAAFTYVYAKKLGATAHRPTERDESVAERRARARKSS